MAREIKVHYFSPTGTTRKVVCAVAKGLSSQTGTNQFMMHNKGDFTLPENRVHSVEFSPEDTVVLGVPVYAGRVPNILLEYLSRLNGNGAAAAAIVVYGNRNYDDSLIELVDLMTARNFKIVGAGAFIGEHSFSYTLAAKRPDEQDLIKAEEFGRQMGAFLDLGKEQAIPLAVKGNRPYRPYYRPLNPQGQAVDIRKVQPKTKSSCTQCGLCSTICPMGSIPLENPQIVKGICIKCGACIKVCPVQAKFYDDENYLRHKEELEKQFCERREPELFL